MVSGSRTQNRTTRTSSPDSSRWSAAAPAINSSPTSTPRWTKSTPIRPPHTRSNARAMDDLDRLFRRLVQNMRAEYPAYLTSPFPVAELYQSVVPYRRNRTALEIEMNQDYEHALTRLLSGERSYVIGDPAMQEALSGVLTSGGGAITYRAYAAALIEVAPEAVRQFDEEQSRTGERSVTPTVSPEVRPKATPPLAIISEGPCLF